MSESPVAAPGPSNRIGTVLGAISGVLGAPLGYVTLGALGFIISDALLWVCVAAPTVLWSIAAAIGKFRPWLLRAVIATAITTAVLVAVVLGGISLLAGLLSDP